jgi:hypothetical protein
MRDGLETDVDCGGASCPPCNTGKTCLANADCQSGRCQGGVCTLGATGATCTSGAGCASGFCADGYCCNTACNGACQACSAALGSGANGTCGNALAGTNPHGTCGVGQVCNGAGACGP